MTMTMTTVIEWEKGFWATKHKAVLETIHRYLIIWYRSINGGIFFFKLYNKVKFSPLYILCRIVYTARELYRILPEASRIYLLTKSVAELFARNSKPERWPKRCEWGPSRKPLRCCTWSDSWRRLHNFLGIHGLCAATSFFPKTATKCRDRLWDMAWPQCF